MDIKNTTDYPSILGQVFNKIFDNPYGKAIRFNGYHTTSLAEVRIGYDGIEPLTDVAAAISKIVKPYGFKAIATKPYLWGTNPLNVHTYNIKVVADNKRSKSIKCRLVVSTALGCPNDFGEYPSIAAAVRTAKGSGYFRYHIFVGNKVVREGFCNNY